jgi:hypothetical protein
MSAPIPTGNIIWKSDAYSNGVDRTMTGHEDRDEYDDRIMISAGDNRELHILGDGYALQSGARARQYILVSNYNASMQFKFVWNNTLDNWSLRIRSRHNEGGSCSNAFGGYGCVLRQDVVDFGDETCHDGGTHRDFGSHDLPHPLVNGTEYEILWSCRDVATNKVELSCWLRGGAYGSITGAWTFIGTSFDTNPTSAMVNKNLYLNSGTKYG